MLGRLIARLEEGAIALLLAAMTIITFAQVVLRYVFNTGLLWALEATIYIFAWLIFFGISYGIKVGSHIGVDAVVKLLPPAGQKAVGLLAAALCMLYAGIVFVGGWHYVDRMRIVGVELEDIPIEKWIVLLIIPIGMAMLFLRLAQAAWRMLRGEAEGFRLADEAKEAIDHLKGGGTGAGVPQ